MQEWQPKYVVEKDGTKRGPFLYSTKWTRVEHQAKLIFGEDQGDSWRDWLKTKAYNKAYVPPDNHIHLARAVITKLNKELVDATRLMIEARREVSKLKRQNNKGR